jgi:hypothetical protein
VIGRLIGPSRSASVTNKRRETAVAHLWQAGCSIPANQCWHTSACSSSSPPCFVSPTTCFQSFFTTTTHVKIKLSNFDADQEDHCYYVQSATQKALSPLQFQGLPTVGTAPKSTEVETSALLPLQALCCVNPDAHTHTHTHLSM